MPFFLHLSINFLDLLTSYSILLYSASSFQFKRAAVYCTSNVSCLSCKCLYSCRTVRILSCESAVYFFNAFASIVSKLTSSLARVYRLCKDVDLVSGSSTEVNRLSNDARFLAEFKLDRGSRLERAESHLLNCLLFNPRGDLWVGFGSLPVIGRETGA